MPTLEELTVEVRVLKLALSKQQDQIDSLLTLLVDQRDIMLHHIPLPKEKDKPPKETPKEKEGGD